MNKLPVMVLFVLSPVIAELLSGSAPPSEFFRFPGLLILTTLYGSGAILVRELTVRWKKGWPSLLVLGAAYGIVEEGLMVKSFFDPGWMDLGLLGTYGRWLGVNWVWSLELTIYHSVISIAIPVMLTEIIFAGRRREPWLGRIGLAFFSCLLAANIALGYLLLTSYRPGGVAYTITWLLVIALVFLAGRLPVQPFHITVQVVRRPLWFWLTGFLATALFFVVFAALPHTVLPPVVTVVISLLLVCMVGWVVIRMSGSGMVWRDIHRLALAAGLLSPMILMSPLQELDAARTDEPAGMALVGLLMALFLIGLWVLVKRRENVLMGTPP
jgi:hypothetical protein